MLSLFELFPEAVEFVLAAIVRRAEIVARHWLSDDVPHTRLPQQSGCYNIKRHGYFGNRSFGKISIGVYGRARQTTFGPDAGAVAQRASSVLSVAAADEEGVEPDARAWMRGCPSLSSPLRMDS